MSTIDPITRRWIRNAADQRAAERGCFMDLDRACYTVWWIGRYCRLYEGEWVGSPLVLRGAHSQPMEAVLDEWDEGGREKSLAFAGEYMDCVDAGEPCDWQYECVMRVFGWSRWSARWQRNVRRFNRGGIWVPKKNKKTPTEAAVALYLLCGDGEQGQKVFLGAKDSIQIRKNMSLHIFQMVEQSPELREECKLNRNEMSVAHLPSRSILMPLSSSNERTQKSKEGLNGSLLVDETHVVDRAFITRVERMGISRSEPIFLQFSTAGKDADCYGKDEFDRGLAVNEGMPDDDAYFFAYYGADQNLTDEQLAADPEGVIRAANPAIGHTIDLDEALADYRRSTRRLADLSEFKVYRLNIWQHTDTPWLRLSDWRRCGQDFVEADLVGQPCAGAIDLGQTDDMTCMTFVFPERATEWSDAAGQLAQTRSAEPASPEEAMQLAARLMTALEQPVRTLSWYWLPEAAVHKYGAEVKYAEWAKDGRLRVLPGEAIDPNDLLDELCGIFQRHNVRMFSYDPWHAAVITRALQTRVYFPTDWCWPFVQGIKSFAFPTALMERLVLRGLLHHDRHPITEWQAGHVRVRTDISGNMRPVKPPREDRKKIDGIVSTIMALDGATRMAALVSVYERRGVLTV